MYSVIVGCSVLKSSLWFAFSIPFVIIGLFCQLLRDVMKSSTMIVAFFLLLIMPIFVLSVLKLCYVYIQILTFGNLLMD